MFEFGNVATDHQQMIMVNLSRVAQRHGMVCLTHEKPFAGVNGSGKHLNYSMGSANAGNLFDPGETPADNAQFLVFCAAMIRAVHDWAPLLRSVVANASNDHRLGANEAPPAILSVFLGTELTNIFESIAKGKSTRSRKNQLSVGVDVIPPIPKHSGDRNRTSPMAFTGNRFEFRAVGSSQSIAGPLVAMNTIMSESLDFCASMLEKSDTSTPKKLGAAVERLVKRVWKDCSLVVFNGDGYSEEWHELAEKRGLPNLRTTACALPALKDKKVARLFDKYNVLSKRELDSRYEVYAEQYVMSLNVESNLMVEMARTVIYPAAVRYQGELADSLVSLSDVGIEPNLEELETLSGLINDLTAAIKALETAKAKHLKTPKAECDWARDGIIPAMEALREVVDTLEGVVADDLWPLPTYQEMLFIR